MKRLFTILVALVMCLGTFSVSASEETPWNAENSILVTVSTATDKEFLETDFPEVDCKEVTVASKKTENGAFIYQLILEVGASKSLKQYIEAVKENPVVTEAERNSYCYLQPILTLDKQSITLFVGETAEVNIESFETYNPSFLYHGVVFSVDPAAFDIGAQNFGIDVYPLIREPEYYGDICDELYEGIDNGILGEKLGTSPINKYFAYVSERGLSGNECDTVIYEVNAILGIDGVLTAEPCGNAVPGAMMPVEQWSVADTSIAGLILTGGEVIETITGGKVDQTARITGLSKGTTTLTLYKRDYAQDATVSCDITVVEGGDANGDGKTDNLDASMVLKYDAAIIELDAEALERCDVNSDGAVNNLDATVILKYDAGIIGNLPDNGSSNYALGKTYILVKDGSLTNPNSLYLDYATGDDKWSDLSLTKMTDGIVGDITLPEYSGSRCGFPDTTVMLVGTNNIFEYIIDLEAYRNDIKSLVFRHVRNSIPGGGNRGFRLRLAYVSDDCVNWNRLSYDLTKTEVEGAPEIMSNLDGNIRNVEHFDYTYTLSDAASGRYIRLLITSDGGYVTQLEEIEVYGVQ